MCRGLVVENNGMVISELEDRVGHSTPVRDDIRNLILQQEYEELLLRNGMVKNPILDDLNAHAVEIFESIRKCLNPELVAFFFGLKAEEKAMFLQTRGITI